MKPMINNYNLGFLFGIRQKSLRTKAPLSKTFYAYIINYKHEKHGGTYVLGNNCMGGTTVRDS